MSKTAGIVLAFFLGGLGIHRFMAGKIGTGILWLCTGGCVGIGWLVDFIMVCTGNFTTKNGEVWAKNN
ncbi:MAG: TM2 domain-containing protein [Clostridia bacterium]